VVSTEDIRFCHSIKLFGNILVEMQALPEHTVATMLYQPTEMFQSTIAVSNLIHHFEDVLLPLIKIL